MKKLVVLTLLLLTTTFSQAQIAKPQYFEFGTQAVDYQGVCKERLHRIDDIIEKYVREGKVPQVVTFVAHKGRVIHNQAVGWRDIESETAVRIDDIFRLYSQTKAVVSVALMTLYEKGEFQLDDPVKKYVPEFSDKVLVEMRPDGTYRTRDAISPVTIRQLLSHSSGVLGNKQLRALHNKNLAERTEPFKTLKEYVLDMASYPLAFDPGTDWNYHPSSDVCGYLVEVFSGETLRAYVKKNIFEPLAMSDSDWYYPIDKKDRLVTAYTLTDGVLTRQEDVWSGSYDPFGSDTLYCQAGQGLYGTIEDYAKFCQMILNGGTFNGNRVLGRRTVELMRQDQLPHPNNSGRELYFGLGFELFPDGVTERRGVKKYTPMVSPGAMQWRGSYNTDYLIDPKEELIVLLYTNTRVDVGLWQAFLNTIYQCLD